jgi:protein-tyrosine phosphatase
VEGLFRILLVCTGNICRSPMAQYMLASALPPTWRVEVSSAGVGALVDHPVAPDGLTVLARLGLADAAKHHQARQITRQIAAQSDLILVASREHRRYLVEEFPGVVARTFTLREFTRLAPMALVATPPTWPGQTTASPVEALRATVQAIAQIRGQVPAPHQPSEDDMPDPYRQGLAAFELTATQIHPAIEAVTAIIKSALNHPTPKI